MIPAKSGWVLIEADGINAWGRIVGMGTHNGQGTWISFDAAITSVVNKRWIPWPCSATNVAFFLLAGLKPRLITSQTQKLGQECPLQYNLRLHRFLEG
jgi:hypothetical protein